ncbi:SusC/RagA family protein [Polaribacter reichenbachii]|uniref:SusC/RagA family TonB-linked outer membrane protein n=1 Tax=Polaribacter reichenbachii TaxID=996801 RepID=A0A1B8TVR2_9FLAO|nr:TonB-dependent receptor [Polaribacter reichenbachii]APZ45415.1 SusC/RagA family protein [Polaribacter reichenbachii]AUC19276.1 SusC/RagA family protein [Polaribacter reichenbachii]OBY63569.1 SusC/RagA family TonB-linked outer membrane protein [Polaribacter reichenbachii]
MGNYTKSYLLLKTRKITETFLIVFISLLANNMFSQTITVTGTVIDVKDETPLPGVSIIIKGTTKGVQTDFDGNYNIKVDGSTDVLVFSYLGFKTKEVKVNGLKTLNVSLEESSQQLDEIVVIGYGSARKSDLTGSVVNISGSDLAKQPIANVGEALSGRLAGVQVLSTEGSPDSDINIRIRGGGSLTQDSSPLVIVDGFPVNSISDVSSSDIENITVLKDASSTAIYGSRGANGVIIITTKSGKDGKVTANFNMFYGVSSIAKTVDVLEADDFVKWQYEYALLRDRLESYEQYFGQWQDYDQYIGQPSTDWQKQIYGRMGNVQSRDLSVRGGSEKFKYSLNYALYDVKAIMLGSNFRRNNFSASIKNKASEKIDLTFTLRYSDTEVNGGGANEQNEVSSRDSRLKHVVGYSPIPLPGLTTDNTDEALSSYLVNPFVAIADSQRQKTKKNFNMVGSFSWEMIKNLKYKMDLGLDNRTDLDSRFYGRSSYYANNRPSAENQGLPATLTRDRDEVRFRNANTLNYDFKNLIKSDNHSIKLLVGEEMIITKSNRLTTEIHGYPKLFDFETAQLLSSQGVPQTVDNFYSPDNKLLSFFGRVNYDYKNKYLLTATYRADGSSKFLGDNSWGYFPSAALAWKISEEDFLKDVEWVDLLKVRLSYGEAGNNNIPVGQTVRALQTNTTTYLNDVTNYWAAPTTLVNPDLKWETTVTQNIGLDFNLFGGKVTGSVEAYKNLTQDLLYLAEVPQSTGYANQYRNLGEIENKGIEGSLNLSILEEKNYGLSLTVNASANKNNINSLGGSDFGENTNWASSQIGDDYVVRVGESIGTMYGFRNDGRYEVSDFDYDATTSSYTLKSGVVDNQWLDNVGPGSMKLKDLTGDGIVNVDDQEIIGNANPDVTGGIILNANAYGFDFSAAFNFSIGNDIYNADKVEFTTSNDNGQFRNLSSVMVDGNRWTNLDPTSGQLVTDPAQLTALNSNTTMWSPYMSRYVFSDWAVEDGSFLRLNTVTLGYTLPEDVIKHIGVSNLRFYMTANNLFVLTNYSGSDPEVSTRRNTPLTPGVDNSAYPRSRQIVFGLNLNF